MRRAKKIITIIPGGGGLGAWPEACRSNPRDTVRKVRLDSAKEHRQSAEWLRSVREKENLSITDLTIMMGYGRTNIKNMLSGERSIPLKASMRLEFQIWERRLRKENLILN